MVKNNSINRRIIKSLDKKWKKGTNARTYIGILLEMAHLDGFSEGTTSSLRIMTMHTPVIFGCGILIGFLYGLDSSYVGAVSNFLIFSTVFLGLQYLTRNKKEFEWD